MASASPSSSISPSWLQVALWLNLFMASSAAGWVIVTSILLDLPLDWMLVALAFVLATGFYTRDRLDASEQKADIAAMPERTRWVRAYSSSLRHFVWFNFALAVMLLICCVAWKCCVRDVRPFMWD